MTELVEQTFEILDSESGTLLSVLRQRLADQSWSALRRLLQARRIAVNDTVCLDEARVLSAGESVTILARPLPAPPKVEDVTIRFVDRHLVVAEKPSGMITVRPKAERVWSLKRRLVQPTVDESISMLIARHAAARSNRGGRVRTPRMFPVHRLDRDASGLMVIARDEATQEALIDQFAKHTAKRVYLALVAGRFSDRTISDRIVRDRGDGLRGTTMDPEAGQSATTHFQVLRRIDAYRELRCELETGRTNQIRVHLAEAGHPICGDRKYRGPIDDARPDRSGCPRLALHAAELGFTHPLTEQPMEYHWAWPTQMLRFLERLQSRER